MGTGYALHRRALNKPCIDYEELGSLLADILENLKLAVAEALFFIRVGCANVMGGGVSGDLIVEQIFRGLRVFWIYAAPAEVHKRIFAK